MPDDILTREIPLPDLDQIAVSYETLSAPLVEIIQQQARIIGVKTAQVGALQETCARQAELIAALRARIEVD